MRRSRRANLNPRAVTPLGHGRRCQGTVGRTARGRSAVSAGRWSSLTFCSLGGQRTDVHCHRLPQGCGGAAAARGGPQPGAGGWRGGGAPGGPSSPSARPALPPDPAAPGRRPQCSVRRRPGHPGVVGVTWGPGGAGHQAPGSQASGLGGVCFRGRDRSFWHSGG